MKWNIVTPALILALTVQTASARMEKFILDPAHSNVQWHVNHFGFSNPSGKWMVSKGSVLLDSEHPDKSHVNVTIRVDKMMTGIPALDKQLKSKLFFDVKQYPTATFISNSVVVTTDKTAKVDGILTLHGVSKPITLYVMLNKLGENPMSNKMTAGFSAVAEIKRSDFGLNALLPELSDEVVLNIEAEAAKRGEMTDVAVRQVEKMEKAALEKLKTPPQTVAASTQRPGPLMQDVPPRDSNPPLTIFKRRPSSPFTMSMKKYLLMI